ncbi:uncharacterized protein VICG_00342 [Vittaforma corneae ATCC 50505]|uniref:RDRP core domain-containing protein n=1 Tax=Vittaforma corneae (strain ATCC 50505) TaxID=993615 RepID=L2GQ38_VITCO|nr:uncharacterized protein VICG_00342 [Vittaforma corneae ATCC 50505]ELA42590.1 hypothetical protein VICG_00342 [Vittaforma corneae ATCC 50505]
MDKNGLRDSFTVEILNRLQDIPPIPLDYIRRILMRDHLLYIPSKDIRTQLLNEWLTYSHANIVVTNSINSDIRQNTSIAHLKTNLTEQMLEESKQTTFIMSYNEFLEQSRHLKNLSITKGNYTFIFEDVKDSEEINQTISDQIVVNSILKFYITDSPSLFISYLEECSKPLCCYVNNIFVMKSAYKSIMENASFFYFDDSENQRNALMKVIVQFNRTDQELAQFLIQRDIFHYLLFEDEYDLNENAKYILKEEKAISGKIQCLIKILEFSKGSNILIYFDSDIDEYIIYELIMLISKPTHREDHINKHLIKNRRMQIYQAIKKGLSNSSRFYISDRILNQSKISLNIHSTRDIQMNREISCNIIFFDFRLFTTQDFKIFMVPESMKISLKTMIVDDSNIGKIYSQYLKKAQSNHATHIDKSTKSYKFEVLSESIDSIKDCIKGKDFILSVDKVDSKTFITARCSIGKIVTCFNLFNIIKEPIIIPRLSTSKQQLILFSDSIELCTITSLKSLCNSKVIHSNGYFVLSDKRLIFYSFSSERNLMLEIETEDVEDFILLSYKRGTGRSKILKTKNFSTKNEKIQGAFENDDEVGTVIKEYLALIDQQEITKEYIIVSFCLRNRPRVYTTEHSNEIASNILNSTDISEKCAFFSTLEWRRLAIDNFNDHEERFDLRIAIPCFQDLPVGSINDFLFSVKEVRLDSLENGSRSEQLSIILKNCWRNTLLKILFEYPARIVATDLVRMTSTISLKNILERFYEYDFSFFYPMACLISRKGRFLLSKITNSDLEYISSQYLPKYCESLDRTLNTRFRPINFRVNIGTKDVKNSIVGNKNRVMIRIAILTPLSVIFNYETTSESNRVLNNFDPDKFCKVVIREENGKDRFMADLAKNTDGVYDYFRRVMLNGFVIGLRKYFFLAMTTSQLKIHGSWFITPYEHDDMVIGADYIKSWIGNFHKIKNIGKYAIRIGLALSSTTPTYPFNDFVEVDDIQKNSYCFTDGIGLITKKWAHNISNILGLGFIPSAFQIRFGGYKGVIAVHPWMDEQKNFEEWLTVNSNIVRGYGKYSNINSLLYSNTSSNDAVNSFHQIVASFKQLGTPDLIVRKSMNKFDSSYRTLEIIAVSKSSSFYLNRQIILILEGLGVPIQIFIDLQDKYIQNMLSKLSQDFTLFIKKYVNTTMNISTDLPFYRKLQSPILSKVFEELNTKSKILIGQGRSAIGVLDELGILEEDQIFCMFQKDVDESMENLKDYGSYIVPNCYCIVAKNPVMHPGDIRVVKCVDAPKLHYLKNVIVFSKKGSRPIFNQCSGSDLDGDIFLVSWCKALIPKATFKPYNYINTCALIKDKVLLSDIVNFYIRHMKFYQLGQIAHSYLAMSDKFSIFNEKSLRLSDIFNKNIDYVKTGHITSIPEDLIPTEYPDFMERSPSYYSTKAIGHLYRRSTFDLSGINFCECHNCTMKEIQEQPRWKRFLLLGAGVKTRETPRNIPFSEEYLSIYENYVSDIRILMDKTQTKTEEDLFCHNFEDDSNLKLELKGVISKYTEILKNKEALKMSKICECKNFNGILALCGDSYKLKSMMKRGIIKNGTSNFIFNSKIYLSYHEESSSLKSSLAEDKQIREFYENRLDCESITIHCDRSNYESFVESLDFKRKDIFKDLFNLIILSGLFRLDQIDNIINLLTNLNKAMKDATIQELLRVAIPNSNNVLFKILCLLPLDFSLIKKSMLLREKALLKSNEMYKISKICKRFCLIISGMLDENDDIEFVKEGKAIIPCLKNKGVCSAEYYKDTLRDFLINILYSNENLRFLEKLPCIKKETESGGQKKWKNNELLDYLEMLTDEKEKLRKKFKGNVPDTMPIPLALYEICFTPGKFSFTLVPETYLNSKFSIKNIERLLSSKSPAEEMLFNFDNVHDALNPKKRAGFLSSIKKMDENGVKEVLSFMYKKTRFDIDILNGKLLRITKDKKTMGKSFIINGLQKNDLQVELFRKEILYDETVNLLKEDEMFMTEKLFVVQNDSYKLLFDLQKYSCTKIKLEKNVVSSNEDGFAIVYKAVFTGNDLLILKTDKSCCYVSKEFCINTVEELNFDKIFGKLWMTYATVL